MRKLNILLVIICGTTFLQAQNVKFGLKGGLNLSNIAISGGDNSINPDTKTRPSIHIGGVVEIKVADKLAIQPELLYTSLGYKFKLSGVEQGYSYSADATDKIEYLAVPIMLKYFVADDFSLEFGPNISYLLSHKGSFKINIPELGVSQSQTIDLAKETENIEFGLNFGASYKLKNNMFFSGRYNLGLSNVEKNASDNEKIKNRNIQISVGYFFKEKSKNIQK